MTDRETKPAHRNILTSLLVTTSELSTNQDTVADLFFFLLRYPFLLNNASKTKNSRVQKTSQLNAPQGNIYMGARYLDPKYSRWISTDPALGEYIPAAGKGNSENAGNLPGMGGIYNHINGDLYHYAGNNPVRYVDPDGKSVKNNAKKFLVGRTEGEIKYELNGVTKSTHYVLLKDGDYSPEAFDGLFDENGNAVKVSGKEEWGDNVDITICSNKDSLYFDFDNADSRKVNKKNDRIKSFLNIFLPKSKEYDLSGIYKDIDKEGKPLHSWWTGGTDKDACGSPDNWEKAYNSDEQKAIRQALNVKGMEE